MTNLQLKTMRMSTKEFGKISINVGIITEKVEMLWQNEKLLMRQNACIGGKGLITEDIQWEIVAAEMSFSPIRGRNKSFLRPLEPLTLLR